LFKITAFTAIFMNCSRRLRLFFNFFQQKTIFIGVLFFLGGCLSENQNEIEIEQIPVSLSFERFDLEFYGNGPEVLPALKRKYPFLFPAQFSDSVWISRQKDSLQLLLQQAVSEQFNDISPLEKEISHLFQHIQYYFPARMPQETRSVAQQCCRAHYGVRRTPRDANTGARHIPAIR